MSEAKLFISKLDTRIVGAIMKQYFFWNKFFLEGDI